MFRVLLSLTLALVCPRLADAATGTVSGTVTRAATSAPVGFAGVVLCDASYNCQYASANASGAFTFTVDPGTYYLYTYNTPGLIGEIYDNVQCEGMCNEYQAVATGTPIVVTSGGTASGRNLVLADGGTISGTITNAATSAPVPGVVVYIYTKAGSSLSYASGASANSAGVYSADGLPAGTYYAHTTNSPGLINEIFDNVPCYGLCNYSILESAGTPIVVTAGATAANRNFALTPGGGIAGTVRNSATSAPIQDVQVNLVAMTAGGPVQAGSADANASGVFTLSGLPDGTYYAYTSNQLGFVNKYVRGRALPRLLSVHAPRDRHTHHGREPAGDAGERLQPRCRGIRQRHGRQLGHLRAGGECLRLRVREVVDGVHGVTSVRAARTHRASIRLAPFPQPPTTWPPTTAARSSTRSSTTSSARSPATTPRLSAAPACPSRRARPCPVRTSRWSPEVRCRARCSACRAWP